MVSENWELPRQEVTDCGKQWSSIGYSYALFSNKTIWSHVHCSPCCSFLPHPPVRFADKKACMNICKILGTWISRLKKIPLKKGTIMGHGAGADHNILWGYVGRMWVSLFDMWLGYTFWCPTHSLIPIQEQREAVSSPSASRWGWDCLEPLVLGC